MGDEVVDDDEVADAKSVAWNRIGMPNALMPAVPRLLVEVTQPMPSVEVWYTKGTVEGMTEAQRSVLYQGQPVVGWQVYELHGIESSRQCEYS